MVTHPRAWSRNLLLSHLNLTLPTKPNLGVEWRAHLVSKLSLKSDSWHTWISLASGARLFHLRRNNYRPKKFACWPYLYLDTFEDIDEPYPDMIAETISSASFVLLVVVSCCVLKIYTMVKNIRPSRNERVRVVYARDNQRASPEREPTVYSTCSSTTYSGSQARRRQPQMHDERFGWQSKQKVSRVFQYNSKIILFCPHRLQPFKLDITIFCLSWLDVILCSPFSRKFSSRIHLRQLKSTGLETNSRVKLFS